MEEDHIAGHLLNLEMSDSRLGSLQPFPCLVTGPKVALQMTQIDLCQEPINLENMSELTLYLFSQPQKLTSCVLNPSI